jgi:putative iron-regulated protein
VSGASLAALVAATDADLNAAMQGILSITMMAQGRIKTVAEAGVSCDMN